MAQSKIFQHQPLDLGSQQIRLLRIIENEQQIVQCTIRTYSIADAIEYYALSYTWGHDAAANEISINGSKYLIHKNLWDFLVVARMRFSQYLFWIDQICIDQTNTEEKNHQVGLMRNIYNNANLVIGWLGAAKNDSDLAMDVVSTLPAILRKIYPVETLSDSNVPNVTQWPRHSYKFTPRIYQAIKTLFARPYWSRLWIIQEVKNTRSMFLCGQKMVSWVDAWHFLHIYEYGGIAFSTLPNQDNHELSLINPFVIILILGVLHEPSSDGNMHTDLPSASTILLEIVNDDANSVTLPRALYMFGAFQCADARDKVYGLLSQTAGSKIVADYDKTTQEVFWDALHASFDTISAPRMGVDLATAKKERQLFHFSIREILDDRFDLTVGLLKHMELLNRPLLVAAVEVLEENIEEAQSLRTRKGSCWDASRSYGERFDQILQHASCLGSDCELQEEIDVHRILRKKLEQQLSRLELHTEQQHGYGAVIMQ
ncbi:hypothetical protein N0V90_011861 [Kalmusia sp. IMI 367209]|nr:hypothetical protein N0V90_011861 [Kalmusia sp. IMI 367209]